MFYLVYLFVAIERPDVGCTGSVRDVATAGSGLCAEQLTVPRNIAARAPLLAPYTLCYVLFPWLSEALPLAWGRAPPLSNKDIVKSPGSPQGSPQASRQAPL